jgi:uracil-DNA glycosylase
MDTVRTMRAPICAPLDTTGLRPTDPRGNDPYSRHIAQIRSCVRCLTVIGPPVVGPAPGARIILIGQAPGPRERVTGYPFAWTAGRTLFAWFAPFGVAEETFRARIHMAAVVRCFPGRDGGGDRVPAPEEIRSCFPFVEREIELLAPGLIIPVGSLAIARFLACTTLDEVIGRRFDGRVGQHPVTVVPLPHPSGRSTWVYRPGNRARLKRALRLITEHPAWRDTFAGMPLEEGKA